MSERNRREVVETQPVVSAPIPTPEAQLARRREEAEFALMRERDTRPENPILRRLSPRRSHWPEIAAYDERARELEQRAAALSDEIARREEALREAGRADREALAQWQLTDGKKRRPEAAAPAIEREIEEKKADRDAAIAASDRVYEDKTRYVEKNRHRLVREADKATTDARTRYEQAIEAAEKARADLIDCRSAALWATLYPGEHATQAPDVAAIAANLRKPVETALGLTTRLPAGGVFRVLRSDAEILADVLTRDQADALGRTEPYRERAIWTQTEEGQAHLRKEHQEARERYRREWGHYPA